MRPTHLAWIVLAAVLFSAVGLIGVARPASAHAEFLDSTPSPYDIWNIPPTYVSVTVSEAVQPGSPDITVTAMNGTRVDDGATTISSTNPATFSVRLEAGLRPSVYTVVWSVVSADDGHFTAGTFYFMMSTAGGALPGPWPQTGTLAVNEPISPLDVGLEAIAFVAFSIAFGGILLAGLLWIPAASGLEPAEWGRPLAGLDRLLRWARLSAFAFAAVAAARIVENLAATPLSGLGPAFSGTFLLGLTAQYATALALVALLYHLLQRMSPATVLQDRPWEFLPAAFLGFALILLEVAVSHSASAMGWWPLGPVADAAHLYGAALWVGGLLAVFLVRPWLRDPTPPDFAQAVLEGFSRFALLGVVLVVSAGLVVGLILVGSVDALVGTAYGWVVLAKGALLVPMIAFGAWNRRVLRRASTTASGPTERVHVVARNVRAEAALGAAVLVLAGLLVTMSPAATPLPVNTAFTLGTTAGGLYAMFQMSPWPTGPGSYIFQIIVFYATNDTAYYGGGTATMSFFREGGNGSWATLPMEGPHGNHYVILSSPVLDAAGTWDLKATLRGPAGTPVDLPFSVTLHG